MGGRGGLLILHNLDGLGEGANDGTAKLCGNLIAFNVELLLPARGSPGDILWDGSKAAEAPRNEQPWAHRDGEDIEGHKEAPGDDQSPVDDVARFMEAKLELL